MKFGNSQIGPVITDLKNNFSIELWMTAKSLA